MHIVFDINGNDKGPQAAIMPLMNFVLKTQMTKLL